MGNIGELEYPLNIRLQIIVINWVKNIVNGDEFTIWSACGKSKW